MRPFDRDVRARIYELCVDQVRPIDPSRIARSGGWSRGDVVASLGRLADEHRIALTDDGAVMMAHPFSAVPTPYWAVTGDGWWWANCAWDSLAILSLLGDGEAHGPDDLVWRVAAGEVHPDGIVHLLVPARAFWDDVAFT